MVGLKQSARTVSGESDTEFKPNYGRIETTISFKLFSVVSVFKPNYGRIETL